MKLFAVLALALLGTWPLPALAQSIKLGAVVPLTGRNQVLGLLSFVCDKAGVLKKRLGL